MAKAQGRSSVGIRSLACLARPAPARSGRSSRRLSALRTIGGALSDACKHSVRGGESRTALIGTTSASGDAPQSRRPHCRAALKVICYYIRRDARERCARGTWGCRRGALLGSTIWGEMTVSPVSIAQREERSHVPKRSSRGVALCRCPWVCLQLWPTARFLGSRSSRR